MPKKKFPEHIDKETYSKAQIALQKLIDGVPVLDEEGKMLGWVEKPDVSAIKFAIETFGVQQMSQ